MAKSGSDKDQSELQDRNQHLMQFGLSEAVRALTAQTQEFDSLRSRSNVLIGGVLAILSMALPVAAQAVPPEENIGGIQWALLSISFVSSLSATFFWYKLNQVSGSRGARYQWNNTYSGHTIVKHYNSWREIEELTKSYETSFRKNTQVLASRRACFQRTLIASVVSGIFMILFLFSLFLLL